MKRKQNFWVPFQKGLNTQELIIEWNTGKEEKCGEKDKDRKCKAERDAWGEYLQKN